MGIILVITPSCLYSSMRRIHWTPHLAHVVLFSVISSFHSLIRLYCIDHIYSLISIQSQHVINLFISSSELNIRYIMFRILNLLLCLFSYGLFQLYTLSYIFSTFQVLTHTCGTSFPDVGSDSQYPDHA